MPIDIKAKQEVLLDVCRELHPDSDYCTPTVVQGMAAISMSETGFSTYGKFQRAPSADEPNGWHSWNMGAMQAGKRADADGNCPPGSFAHADSSPVTGRYEGCFLTWPTEREGMTAFVKLLTVQRKGIAGALTTGDTWALSSAMKSAGYYEGTGATERDRIKNHVKALQRNIDIVAARTGEQVAWVAVEPPMPPPPDHRTETGVAIGGGAVGTAVLIAEGVRRVVRSRLGSGGED